MKSKNKLPEPPPDPRLKVRIYRNGTHLIEEFYIEDGQKVIDIDLYYNVPEFDFTINTNYPAERIKA